MGINRNKIAKKLFSFTVLHFSTDLMQEKITGIYRLRQQTLGGS